MTPHVLVYRPVLIDIMMRMYTTCLYSILQALTSSSIAEMIRLAPENVGIADRTVWQLSSLTLPSSTKADTLPYLTHTVASKLLVLFARVQTE